ncbi:MAG: TnpV protein [Defluviitaleaceae bacterium]|nr:TnpV protein [Defluviitaleaceae bacterium]MCL2275478.1 TnpV protein [Defluviitaleaceae bacterium]
MPSNISYSQVGDYLRPNIALSEPKDTKPLDKYGRMRKAYLKNHRLILYNQLLLTEKLYPHLRDIQRVAQQRLDVIISHFVQRNPPPNKSTDQMGWVAHMKALHHTAEAIVISELVYK